MSVARPSSVKSATVSEITLDLPENLQESRRHTLTKKQIARNVPCTVKKHGSVRTMSVQNLDMPEMLKAKPFLKVKCPTGAPVKVAAVCHAQTKIRPANASSSSSSRLEGWVLPIPRKFKRKCSATSTETEASLSMASVGAQESESDQLDVSQEMKGTMHEGSEKKLNFKGPEWAAPCKESFVAGAPRPYIGTCPMNLEAFAKMSKTRQKFFLTQDPRKRHCLVNPEVLRTKAYSAKKEFKTLTKMVKQADNICMESASQSSESFICDVIDVENPLGLDFQGLDYKNTYEKDEQDIQNQRIYRRVLRYMDRKRVSAEAEKMVEEEIHRNHIAIPSCFEVKNREDIREPTPSIESIHIGKLYRSVDKPANKRVIAHEHKRRVERYKELFMRRKEKAELLREKEEEKAAQREENLATRVMLKNFNSAMEHINDAIRRTFRQERTLKRKVLRRRIFPHTLRETLNFKRDLKMRDRIKRDEAKVRAEFYKDRLGKIKKYPEADVELSSDSVKSPIPRAKMSEQSSDDDDGLEVGKEGERYKLRGFHFQLGESLRGKRSEKERKGTVGQRREKGCITRDQWITELAPKKEVIQLDVEMGIEKIKNPDDQDLVLFRPHFGFKAPKAKTSAVREYRQKRLGRHYHRQMRKKLKLLKPKLRFTVKKFNLIRYLYGDDDKINMQNADDDFEENMKLKSTQEYIEARARLKKKKQEIIKQKRQVLLGLPCKVVRKSRVQTLCENSESETDLDWVPERESDLKSDDDLAERTKTRIPLRQRGNMPAPPHRDTTLRCHPRHPRNYLGERAPSQLFDQAVKTTGIPHMYKLPEDLIQFTNIHRLKKRPYTTLFGARYHHDHWDPRQQKYVDVHYQTNIVTADITKLKKKADKVINSFDMANPPCNAYVDMDLTMPHYDVDEMIKEYEEPAKQKTTAAPTEKIKNVCQTRDFVFHSRSKEEKVDFPGHQEYLQFLQEIREKLQEKTDNDKTESLFVDREALVKELEEDLKSIESCLTSLSSSQCTNLSNDSGSFLLLEGRTKVPLNYIRNSLVPFEELQRSRFQVEPIDVDAEDANPYKVMPFSGQKKAQVEISGPKDSFFTFNTRLQNGLRLRLEVPVQDVRQKLLGRGPNKFPGAVTTDIDEDYVTELKNRPSVKMFNFKSGRSMIKDALRLKFESMLIQGQIVRTKIYDRLNEQHWEQMQRTKLLYEKLFAKWEKKEYDASMSVVYKVKTYYDMTDILKRQFRDVEREMLILNMDIVYIEADWIHRIMLQNFHYLLADTDWRYENDWLHSFVGDNGEVELESFVDSIAKRSTLNIRQREKDDAWAIMTFYVENYKNMKHPILIVFPDADSFLKGIENLKTKTFVLLLELHFTLSIHTELQGRLETFEEWCIKDITEKREYVTRKSAKKVFMIGRANNLMATTMNFVNEPVEKSFNDEEYNRNRAVIAEVWRQIVPASVRGSSDKDLEPIDMVAMMAEVVLELMSKFESVPADKRRKIESALRKRLAYMRKQSFAAYQVEKRIESEMKKVKKNLEPPFKKPKRKGKLPRYFIKKIIPPVVVKEKHISEHTKFFYRAFHEDGDVTNLDEARDSLHVMDNIQDQIVPFYFDHFLRLHGYTPNYNFQTQVEMRDGPEINRCRVVSVLPDVISKLERLEAIRKKTMEENITRNPKMYENINA